MDGDDLSIPTTEDTELRHAAHRAAGDGADTSGLDEALAETDRQTAEDVEALAEIDDHVRQARADVDADPELHPERGRPFYESGSVGADLDDQSIAPPG